MPQEFIHPATGDKVKLERWTWRVQYKDGRILDQFSEDLIFHRFAEIDMPQAAVWQLRSPDKPPITFLVNPGDKLIHAYRRFGLDYMGEHRRECLYVFGVERDGKKQLAVVGPTDEVVLTDNVDRVTIT